MSYTARSVYAERHLGILKKSELIALWNKYCLDIAETDSSNEGKIDGVIFTNNTDNVVKCFPDAVSCYKAMVNLTPDHYHAENAFFTAKTIDGERKILGFDEHDEANSPYDETVLLEWLSSDDKLEKFAFINPVELMLQDMEYMCDSEIIEKWNAYRHHLHDNTNKVYYNTNAGLELCFQKQLYGMVTATQHDRYDAQHSYFFQPNPNEYTIVSFGYLRNINVEADRNPINLTELAQYLVENTF